MRGGLVISDIQEGSPAELASSKSDFINKALALKPGHYFTVNGIKQNCLYQRLVYIEWKYGVKAVWRRVRAGHDEFRVFLRQEKKAS